jgi:hypothetical protein|tara:strand:- start:632 stop:964 length:333 start_codon:yes stop_codon:yes gene_type:complete
MSVTFTWSIDSHKHETSGNKYISNCSYICTASESTFLASVNGNVVLDRPSDSDMKDYDTFLGTGDTNLVAAVKAKLGTTVVNNIEAEANAALVLVKTPTHVWTEGPKASS